MENKSLDQDINLLEDYYFKLSYKNQKYKKLKEYQKWKKLVVEKYGKNGKEIICNKDNTIIYQIHNDNDQKIICPTCNTIIYNCIFCNKIKNVNLYNCCFRAYFKYRINVNYKYRFTNLNEKDPIIKQHFIKLLLISFIPFYPLFSFIYGLTDVLCFYVDLGKGDLGSNVPFILLFYGLLLIMTIIYGIVYYLIFISLIIISIPFQLYQIKIFLGIVGIFMEGDYLDYLD